MARGRRSAVSLGVVPAAPAHERPSPPPGLSEAEIAAWTAVVGSMPATWFRGSETLLRAYVSQGVTSAALEDRIRSMLVGSGPIDRQLLTAHAKATSALIRTAASLRLSPGSRYTPRAAAGRLSEAKSPRSRPWEVRGDDSEPA